MQLEERITADLKNALIAGDSSTVSVLRLLKAEVKNASIAQGELDEAGVLQIIRKEIKKRTDAVELFKQGGRDEQAASEAREAELLRAYLPVQASTEEIEAFVTQQIASLEDRSPKQRGDVIRSTVAHFAGKTDGKTVSEIVSRLLV